MICPLMTVMFMFTGVTCLGEIFNVTLVNIFSKDLVINCELFTSWRPPARQQPACRATIFLPVDNLLCLLTIFGLSTSCRQVINLLPDSSLASTIFLIPGEIKPETSFPLPLTTNGASSNTWRSSRSFPPLQTSNPQGNTSALMVEIISFHRPSSHESSRLSDNNQLSFRQPTLASVFLPAHQSVSLPNPLTSPLPPRCLFPSGLSLLRLPYLLSGCFSAPILIPRFNFRPLH